MKVRSKEEFVDFISKDRAWRKRELTNIKYLIERSKDGYVDLNLRAATLLLYSHWEGFVKHSTKVFFYYLSQSGIKYSRLNNNLIVSGVVKQGERMSV
ncbi:MAE_28990/MAE_18760 family HEPN-like nuclease [Pseudaeromonas pectinilytica]